MVGTGLATLADSRGPMLAKVPSSVIPNEGIESGGARELRSLDVWHCAKLHDPKLDTCLVRHRGHYDRTVGIKVAFVRAARASGLSGPRPALYRSWDSS